MIQNIGTSLHQTHAAYSTSNVGITPDQQKQLNEDMQAIQDAASKYPPGPKQYAAVTVATQKYELDYAHFTGKPTGELQAAYEQTLADSTITDPDKLQTKIQLDEARFNMRLTMCNYNLNPTQKNTLAQDFAALEHASQNPDRIERYANMEVASDQLKLDQTLFTHPNLDPTTLNNDLSTLKKDLSISDPNEKAMKIAVDDARLQKDTIKSIYPLTQQEKTDLDTDFQKAEDALNTGEPKTRPERVQAALSKLNVLESQLIYKYSHPQSE